MKDSHSVKLGPYCWSERAKAMEREERKWGQGPIAFKTIWAHPHLSPEFTKLEEQLTKEWAAEYPGIQQERVRTYTADDCHYFNPALINIMMNTIYPSCCDRYFRVCSSRHSTRKSRAPTQRPTEQPMVQAPWRSFTMALLCHKWLSYELSFEAISERYIKTFILIPYSS